MKTEIFTGTYQKLKERLDIIIATPNIINQVVVIKGGVFLIIYT